MSEFSVTRRNMVLAVTALGSIVNQLFGTVIILTSGPMPKPEDGGKTA